MIARRRELADNYCRLLADIRDLAMPREPGWARSNWQSYCVRLPAGAEQREVMQSMLDAGVSTHRGIMCSHREQAYEGLALPHCLTHSEAAQDECLLLPLYPGLTHDEQRQVADALRAAVRQREAQHA